MSGSWSVEELDRTPSAWLSEVALAALSWQGGEMAPSWRLWVHHAHPPDALPDGDRVLLESEVTESPFVLSRTPAPSPAVVSALLDVTSPADASALVVLTPAYISQLASYPLPLLVPAGPGFPHDGEEPMVPSASVRTPVLVATGCTRDGASAMLARPLSDATSLALAEGGLDLGDAGVLCLQPSRLALPWVRVAFTGRSRVPPAQLAPGVELPLLSLWLLRILEASTSLEISEALDLLPLWAGRYPTWESLRADQQTAREVGEVVERLVAARIDAELFGAVLLSELPAPVTLVKAVEARLSWRQRRRFLSILSSERRFALWLSPDRPRFTPTPWR